MNEGFACNISHLLFSEEFFSVVAHSLYKPDEAKLRAVSMKYASDEHCRMAGYCIGGKLAGCVGVDLADPEKAVLHHLAVDPAHRGRGIGRELIGQLIAHYSIRRLEAETDDDAVGFYRKCGFSVSDLGEKYPGTRRYLCFRIQ